MKNLFLLTILTLAFALSANAQTEPAKVEVLQTTADKCSRCFDTETALRAEMAVKDSAIETLKAELTRVQIEKALIAGELIGLKQQAIDQRAIIQLLLQNVKKKRNALITIF